MAEAKTKPTDVDPDDYLATVDEPRRSQGKTIMELMRRITGEKPVMWGPTMIGFGTSHYEGKTTKGDWFHVGFSPRKAAMTIYGVYDDYGPEDPLFDKLGPHTTGRSCLYLKSLDTIDLAVLEELISQSGHAANRPDPQPEGR